MEVKRMPYIPVKRYKQKCRFCGYEWQSYKEHPVQCPLCKRYLIEKPNEVTGKHKCPYCGKRFKTERGLKTHIGMVHKKRNRLGYNRPNLEGSPKEEKGE